MAAGPIQAYLNGMSSIQKQNVDWINDTIKALLLVDGHTVDLAAHLTVSDVVADEHAGTGNYARQTLTGKTSGLSGNDHSFNSAAVAFGPNATISARYIVFYKEVTNDTDSLLLFIGDLTGSGNLSSVNSDFTVTPNAGGWHIIDINA